ncbi:MAG: M56 family metallopeptidase [Chloroflexota bacterium]
MPEPSSWRRADVALALLVGLALLAGFCALSLSGRGLIAALALIVTVCQRTLDETLAHGADLGRLSLLLPVGIGLTLATAEALRSTLATRRWIAALGSGRCVPTEHLRYLAQRCGLTNDVVRVNAAQPLVFTHGLLRPRVWLSTGLLASLTDDELEAVLRHEAHHLQARDPLKILLARCLSRALFFIPVARDLTQAYCTTKEIAADQHAVQAMGKALPLARALCKLITISPTLPLEAALVGERNVVETRLLVLLDPIRSLPLFRPRHLGLSLLWLLLFLVVALAPAAGHVPSFTECAAAASGFQQLAGL